MLFSGYQLAMLILDIGMFTGFSALDFDLDYSELELELEAKKFGQIFNISLDVNPIRVACKARTNLNETEELAKREKVCKSVCPSDDSDCHDWPQQIDPFCKEALRRIIWDEDARNHCRNVGESCQRDTSGGFVICYESRLDAESENGREISASQQLNNAVGNKVAYLCEMKGRRLNAKTVWHGIGVEYCARWANQNQTELMVAAHLMASYSMKSIRLPIVKRLLKVSVTLPYVHLITLNFGEFANCTDGYGRDCMTSGVIEIQKPIWRQPTNCKPGDDCYIAGFLNRPVQFKRKFKKLSNNDEVDDGNSAQQLSRRVTSKDSNVLTTKNFPFGLSSLDLDRDGKMLLLTSGADCWIHQIYINHELYNKCPPPDMMTKTAVHEETTISGDA